MMPAEWNRFMREFPNWWEIGGREKEGKLAIKAARLETELANRRIPLSVPLAYPNDPVAQQGFENVYKNRLHLLRS